MPASPTTSLRRGVAYPRPYVALAFQAFKRRVHGADRDFTPRARFDLATDRGAVGVATEPQQRQENELLEFAERWSHETYILHNVDYIASAPLERRTHDGPRRVGTQRVRGCIRLVFALVDDISTQLRH